MAQVDAARRSPRPEEDPTHARLAGNGDGSPTVARLADEVREAKRRRLKGRVFADWNRSLERVILPQLGGCEVRVLTPDRLAAFIRELEDRGLAAASIRSYLKPLGAITSLACRRGYLEQNPFALLQPDEKPRPALRRRPFEWTPESVASLLRHARRRGERPHARYAYLPPLATLALTGARVGEVLALQIGDVDLDEKLIRIRHSWSRDGHLTTPKTPAAVRDLPLPRDLEALLRPLLATVDQKAWLFPSRSGRQPLSYWNLAKRGFAPALADADLGGRGIRLHDLRHAAASLLIAAGLTPVEVAAQLGHTDPAVSLKIYAHLFDRQRSHERTRAAFDAIALD